MYTINLVGKAYILEADYETTLGTAALENVIIKNRKKHGHKKVSYNYLGSPTQGDHNSRRTQYSQVFFILFSCFSCGKFEKTIVTSIETRSFYVFISN